MNGEPLRRTVIVRNSLGFHMRPVTAFAERASKFQSEVLIGREGEDMVNGKSPMTMLSSVLVEQGRALVLQVQGPDADQAMDALVKFFDELVQLEP